MSAVVSGLIGAVVAFAFVELAERRQKKARVLPSGWKTLQAGWLLNGLIVTSAALTTLFAYFLLNGGSARPDAERQNGYALLLVVLSGSIALYTTWAAHGRTIMWKGNELRVRTIMGNEVVRRISDVSSVTKSEMRGEYRLRFRDGSKLWLSAYFHGAKELVGKLPQRGRQD